MEEIHLELLKNLDVVGLSWYRTEFCSIAWTLRAVSLDWQIGVVAITLLSLPGKVY